MPTLPFQPSFRTALLTLGAALLLAACTKPAPPAEPVRSVKLLTVGTAGFESGYEFAGEVRARVESRLGFRVAGKIVRRQAEFANVLCRQAALVLRRMPDVDAGAQLLQAVRHRGAVQVAAAHLEAEVQQYFGDAAHADAADGHQVDVSRVAEQVPYSRVRTGSARPAA